MTITLAFSWWTIPTIILVIGLIWAFTRDDGGGYLSGIINLLALIPVLAISLIAFIIGACFK